eukprot:2700644-Amphidinium_carterae.1
MHSSGFDTFALTKPYGWGCECCAWVPRDRAAGSAKAARGGEGLKEAAVPCVQKTLHYQIKV